MVFIVVETGWYGTKILPTCNKKKNWEQNNTINGHYKFFPFFSIPMDVSLPSTALIKNSQLSNESSLINGKIPYGQEKAEAFSNALVNQQKPISKF